MGETDKHEAAVLLRLFVDIKNDADLFLKKEQPVYATTDSYYTNIDLLRSIIEQYNKAALRYNQLQKNSFYQLKGVTIPAIKIFNPGYGTYRGMEKSQVLPIMKDITYECSATVAYLESLSKTPPPEKRTELARLREDLERFSSELPLNYTKNCRCAVEELETGNNLAAALIAARGFENARKKCFSGLTEEKIIEELIAKGLIDKERKDLASSLIKSLRNARNYSMHDVSIYPEYSDASSLVTDHISFLRIVKDLLKKAYE